MYNSCHLTLLRELYLGFVQQFDGDSDGAGHLENGHYNSKIQGRLGSVPKGTNRL